MCGVLLPPTHPAENTLIFRIWLRILDSFKKFVLLDYNSNFCSILPRAFPKTFFKTAVNKVLGDVFNALFKVTGENLNVFVWLLSEVTVRITQKVQNEPK